MPTPIHTIEDLRSQRAEAITGIRTIVDKSRSENRGLTAEEKQEHSKLSAEFDDLTATIDVEEKTRAMELTAAHPTQAAPNVKVRNGIVDPAALEFEFDGEDDPYPLEAFAPKAYDRAFRDYLRKSESRMSPEARETIDKAHEFAAAAYNITTPADGGYTVPETWRANLVETRTQFGVIRQLATIIPTSNGNLIHLPKVVDGQTAAEIDEEGGYTESEDTFDEVQLGAYKYGAIVKISEELLIDSMFDLQPFITKRAGRALGLKEGHEFSIGDGSDGPNGICHAAGVGLTTADDTTFTADELLAMVHTVTPPYRTQAQWVMHDSTVLYVAQLVDDTNNYVWQPGLLAGTPDRIRGYPVFADPFYATIGAAHVVATFGDHSEYVIRDAGTIAAQRLNELYAVNGQVGFRFGERVDGDLVDTAAVKSMKTHA